MDVLLLSRIQFGETAAFHILFPLMSIGFAFYLVLMEALWLYTKQDVYYHQLRFWVKIFVLTFAVGVATGFPLSLQFGTNWSTFATAAGSFFGNILGFETTIAFTLETASLGIFLFGWNKVPKAIHFLSGLFILLGASLSAFWIIVANSWMQIPRGVIFDGTKVFVTDYKAAILNSEAVLSFLHMWFACIVSTMFLIAGISALVLLRRAASDPARAFFTLSLKYALVVALVFTPLQMVVGDLSGPIIAENQPAKLAAYELHWDTNEAGSGADLNLIAIPALDGGKNTYEVSVPGALSTLVTHDPQGTVMGLNEFAPEDRPNETEAFITFISFRVMVGCGIVMLLVALWGALLMMRKNMNALQIGNHRWFLRACVASIPLGFIATETGWMVREIGRQPWMIYNIMRVSGSLSHQLEVPVITTAIAGLTLLYAICGFLFIFFTVRIVRKGPDFISPVL